jgi:hypothetical protein
VSARVLAVALGPNFTVPSLCAKHMGCLALPPEMPALVAVRACVSGLLAGGAVVFWGAGGQVTDDRHVGSRRGRGKWHVGSARKM